MLGPLAEQAFRGIFDFRLKRGKGPFRSIVSRLF